MMGHGCTPRPNQQRPRVCRNPARAGAYHQLEIVDCTEIRKGFIAGAIPAGPPVDEHLRACAHCGELFGNGALLGRGLARAATRADDDIAEQLLATESLLADERGLRAFLRSRSTRLRWVLSLVLPAVLLVRELLSKRVSMRELGTLRVFAASLLLGVLVAVAHSALCPLPIERRAARLRWLLALVVWCLPCVLWLAPEASVNAEQVSSSGFAARALSCFGYGSLLAAPSVALLWTLDRGARVPFRVGALAAGLVAVLSNLLLLLHCPSTQHAHLVAGHFSIGLAWFAVLAVATQSRSRDAAS